MKASQSTQASQSLFESAISPMQLEMNRYLNHIDRPPANCEILKWWKDHCKEFPLLAKCARKYLCIQASSASSERTFSTGGSIVTYKRTKLDVENVHMLVYCKDNLSKVEITTKIFEDNEEHAAEEEFSFEDESTELLVPGSAKIKHLNTGKKTQVTTSSTPVSSRTSSASSQAGSQTGSRSSSGSGPRSGSRSPTASGSGKTSKLSDLVNLDDDSS